MRFLRSILASIFFKIALSLSLIFVLYASVIAVRYDFTVCTGITFDRPYTPLDARELHGEGRIRFVPLDKFPTSTLHALANYYKQKYDLAIELASPMLLPSRAIDQSRGQLISDVVIEILQTNHPQPPTERLIVIGLVETDMYIPGVNWRYAISSRRADRYAVVSTARLDRGCLGLVTVSHERMTSRLRKMVTKTIGILYFRLPLSDDPRSVLYSKIRGSQEFDRMSEDF
jgi:predicted Zn-dependent protease